MSYPSQSDGKMGEPDQSFRIVKQQPPSRSAMAVAMGKRVDWCKQNWLVIAVIILYIVTVAMIPNWVHIQIEESTRRLKEKMDLVLAQDHKFVARNWDHSN